MRPSPFESLPLPSPSLWPLTVPHGPVWALMILYNNQSFIEIASGKGQRTGNLSTNIFVQNCKLGSAPIFHK